METKTALSMVLQKADLMEIKRGLKKVLEMVERTEHSKAKLMVA